MSSDLIALALAEDVGDGDVTTRYFTDPRRQGTARIFAKESCVLAGTDVATEVFKRVDPSLQVTVAVPDGSRLQAGETVLHLAGAIGSLLTAERVALNFLQRLSGIATATRRCVEAVQGTSTRILDTRKTAPGWRALEKAAVLAGGGRNHRMGLFDMVMVKDNHLAAGTSLEGLQTAIRRVKSERPGILVELEADTLDQVREFLTLEGVDVILLDNMSNEQMREAVSLRRPGLTFEASGGITLERLRSIAETGVDFISIGALTHSVMAVDLSLEILHESLAA